MRPSTSLHLTASASLRSTGRKQPSPTPLLHHHHLHRQQNQRQAHQLRPRISHPITPLAHATTLHHHRSKSTHYPPPPHPAGPSKRHTVLPKPTQPTSSLPHEERVAANRQRGPPQPPRRPGPPRLVRYEDHVNQPERSSPLSLYPRSFAHPSYPDPASYRAHLSSRRAPASLFGLFPSATSTAASLTLPPTTSVFAKQPPPTSQSGNAAAAAAATSHAVEPYQPAASTPAKLDSTMSSSTAVPANEGELRQRKGAAAEEDAGAAHHDHGHGDHDHKHSLFGHSHHHGHDHGSAEEADQLIAALKGKGDRGSNITLLGLASNVGLCGAKGVAGVYLNSAALLADAAHSLSDMFADLVTLFCWKMSQKPPSASHPLGYGKYETMGSLGVSLVLVAGAVGIGFHSYGLLLEALQPTLQHAPAAIQAFGSFTGSIAHAGSHVGHSHDTAAAAGGEGGLLDPNAMWFALASVLIKEWLYHATLKIAKEENSSVLEANALHHRSDSLSSAVTFLAIGGSWLGFPVLDPLGGLLVAGLIGKQGADLLIGALGELSDRGVEPEVLQRFDRAIAAVQRDEFPQLLRGWRDLRAVKSGVSTFADVTLELPGQTSLETAGEVEVRVRDAIVKAVKGVKEVRVRLDVVDEQA
ncbi:uncharacterized protein PFL1_00288 [Pseudozyma flocculosa PF-1]|uniref:Related to MMT1 - Mitochondrial iron transport protein n=1 Tax=Pseudozyma flocculosa TaxID=84751 RepID=A0A5C3EV29_9BASI|nr:uncharacterized protein PFL1_00288 [Pseudozyma flocculosa PF-1]EPQ32091.1 hypothetical protein PFL1_00288 [Pseudozyma flocculosa PF-1]SPO34979.1 related to MMT1 - Mitochondrial iron transport protein [Pseudozyma flocculosa]